MSYEKEISGKRWNSGEHFADHACIVIIQKIYILDEK